MKARILIIMLLMLGEAAAAQQPGTLDSTFDVDGKVITSFGNFDDKIFSIVVQPDGKIVAGGSSSNGTNHDFAIARYNNDASLDTTFGLGGKVITPIDTGEDWLYDITLQADGKIVTVGQSLSGGKWNFALVRYNIDGSLDSTFGTNGIQATAITPQDDFAKTARIASDGKIYVGGGTGNIHGDFIIARYDSLGQLDMAFGNNGVTITDLSNGDYLSSIALQNDGKIIAGGGVTGFSGCPCFILLRYDSTGVIDSTFDYDGIVATSMGSNMAQVNALAIQLDGKIVAGGGVDFGGGSTWDFALARYNIDGNIDSSFGLNGKVIASLGGGRDILSEIKIQPDGKIVAAGSSTRPLSEDFALVRYNSNGTLDSTFGNSGKVFTNFIGQDDLGLAMDFQPDLKIVVAGQSYQNGKWNFALARYISGLNVGTIDFESKNNPMLIYPNPIKDHATLKYTLTKDETLTIRLFDLNGKLVKTMMNNVTRVQGAHEEELSFNETILPGSYVLQIGNGKSQQAIKIIHY